MRDWRRLSLLLAFLLLLGWSSAPTYADGQKKGSGKSSSTSKPKSAPKPKAAPKPKSPDSDKTVSVREYTRKDGTKVRAHKRRPPGTATATAASTPSEGSSGSSSTAGSSTSSPTVDRASSSGATADSVRKTPATREWEAVTGAAPSASVGGQSMEVSPTSLSPIPVQELREVLLAREAPAFLVPDASRTPLRVLPANTRLRVLELQEHWIKAEFKDPQFGPRVGYVERRHVK